MYPGVALQPKFIPKEQNNNNRRWGLLYTSYMPAAKSGHKKGRAVAKSTRESKTDHKSEFIQVSPVSCNVDCHLEETNPGRHQVAFSAFLLVHL